jgi:hypothetical protein
MDNLLVFQMLMNESASLVCKINSLLMGGAETQIKND